MFMCANLRLKYLLPFSFACTRDYSLLVGKKVYKKPKSSIFVYANQKNLIIWRFEKATIL
ncbi:hypothetical protein KSB_31640 [Ktedonobacter robiniae]|uniref:Uncharacterized protein n=1 Tax=Ktedonobacter robiniae TaxID=2778365 RepID=A0ABQ3UPM6_9CHLR|nr:hypothetical protein KSB_31640 [Ktedonobacter robiniae]